MEEDGMIAQGETEILKLYRLHKTIRESGMEIDEDDDAWQTAVYAKLNVVEERMMKIPSTCAADMAAKMIVAHCYGSFSCLEENDPVWKEAKELVNSQT